MIADKTLNPPPISKTIIIAGIIISGLLWYVSFGLTGDFWYLVWLAPVPVLLLSLKTTGKAAFLIAFVAYLIGRMSWFVYLARVCTIVPAIILTLLLPLVFAAIILLARWLILRINSWYAIFAFPALFTAFEYLVVNFSADGTAASVAYTQMNCLPLIQVASIAGILGITFMVTFIPSAIALAWHYRTNKKRLWAITGVAMLLLAAVFLYGWIRPNYYSQKGSVKVGLVVLDEDVHSNSDHPQLAKEKPVAEAYAKQIALLADQGAQLVVLPERAIGIDKTFADSITSILSATAKQHHVFIIAGYTNQKADPERNSALVIDTAGNVAVDYNKEHMVKGFESQFTPGTQLGLFKLNGINAGVAICKDMDFQAYLKKYGESKTGLLFAPAWDFTMDDWLHARMAILRSVENGFSQVRCARKGRLTINDQFGRVTAEAISSTDKLTSLIGTASPQRYGTFYTEYGDWLGVVSLIMAAVFVVMALIKRK